MFVGVISLLSLGYRLFGLRLAEDYQVMLIPSNFATFGERASARSRTLEQLYARLVVGKEGSGYGFAAKHRDAAYGLLD